MKKTAFSLVLVVVAAAVAFVALTPSAKRVLRPDDASDDGPAASDAAPTALSTPAGTTPKPSHVPTRIVDEAPSESVTIGDGPAILGIVVDAETGKPVAGAEVFAEPSAEPCPRAPGFAYLTRNMKRGHPDIAETNRAPSDKDGAFRVPWDKSGSADLFVKAPGFTIACSCRATTAAPVTVRLEHGLSIEGLVVSRDDKPIAGVRVATTTPSPSATGLGHEEAATTNAEGRFAISGLVAGRVIVRAELPPTWMATQSEPVEPGQRDVKLVLIPAFIVAFTFKTDDGRRPETPTVAWTTTGAPPRSGLELLTEDPSFGASNIANPGPANADPSWVPVRLPADRPTVRFEVKALGYSTWTSQPVEIPAEGGAAAIAVELKRDPNLGRLIVHLEDRDGKVLSYVDERAQPSIWRRDGQGISAGIVLKPAETLELPALPSGPYGLLIRSPGHAPSLLDKIDVAAGRDTEVRAVLGVPAKVRVRFTAPERLTVRFRLIQGREVAIPFPEVSAGVRASEDPRDGPGDGSLDAGPDGIVLSGLATGRYTIEVISPDLTAASTAVDLVEGDTKEIEISVSKK